MINLNKIQELKRQILIAEENLEAAKKTLIELTKDEPPLKEDLLVNGTEPKISDDGTIIEGIFNGEDMLGPNNKIYPVPANYASKSKLVEGDRLKLTIASDGSFVFKQIAPVKRISVRGVLKFDQNAYHVLANGDSYQVLFASVSYYKGKPGDRVSIIVPAEIKSKWAALDSILHDHDLVEDTTASVPKNDLLNYGDKAQDKVKIENIQPKNIISQEISKEAILSNSNNQEASKKEQGEGNFKDFLGIDNININPVSRYAPPQAVSPAEIPSPTQNRVTAPSANVGRPSDSSFGRISEMDI